MQGDLPYDYANIADAPWYDPDEPDLSSRFYGAYGIEMRGLSDSTREAAITQKNGDGAVVSGYRHGPREVRVRAWLTAVGTDALEHGNTWLRNVLEPNACGTHGGACGAADSAFFVDCPPARRDVTAYTDWAEARRNFIANPSFETNTTGWSGSNGTLSRVTSGGFRGVAFARVTATSATLLGLLGPNITVAAAESWAMSAYVKGTVGRQVRARVVWSTGATNYGGLVTLTGSWQRVSVVADAPAGAVWGHMDVIYFANATVGDVLDVDAALMEKAGSIEDYFDGASVDDPSPEPLYRYEWTGSANASASIREERNPYITPEGDATYGPYVDQHRRFLHSVRCISGPFVIQEASSEEVPGLVGRLVEFTLLAEVPWVYGMPKEIVVPPTVPTVMQDIAYNLAPYPSAELPGEAIVVAENLSTNPSLETNATGWSTITDGSVITGAMAPAGARVVGELQAVGTASYRTVFTASGASASTGMFGNRQEVALGSIVDKRYSFNIWSAAVIMAGAPVLNDLFVYATWRATAGGAGLRTDLLGTIPAAGGALSVKSLTPPATAAFVEVAVRSTITSWNAGSIVRLYSDALAVTTP